jgi:hypothetical protein
MRAHASSPGGECDERRLHGLRLPDLADLPPGDVARGVEVNCTSTVQQYFGPGAVVGEAVTDDFLA